MGVALISGGSSGIGYACASELLSRGEAVVLLARDASRLQAAQQSLSRRWPVATVVARQLDVVEESACRELVAEVENSYGTPTWLVTSAGLARPGLFLSQPLSEHREQLETNYLGTLNLIHAVAPMMAKAGQGRLVLIASCAALFGVYGYAAYSPSKFAVRGLGEVLRVELAEHGVSVTVAYPPDTDTPQLVQEEVTKPETTRRITGGGGVWKPEAVGRRIIEGAERGKFAVAPGLAASALAGWHSLLHPALRQWQERVARGVRAENQDR